MWSNKRERFDELVEKLVEALTNRESDPLLIGDVVLDANGLESSFTYSVPGTVTDPAWHTFTP